MKKIMLKTCEILARMKCVFLLSDFWLSLRAGPETSDCFTKLHFTCGLSAPALAQISWCCSGVIREGNGKPLQYSCLENPMDGGAWWAAVHGVAKCWTQLRDFTLAFHFHALEKAMATQCSCLENPRYGRAWWSAIYGVAQSQTRLKRLSSSSSSSSSSSGVMRALGPTEQEQVVGCSCWGPTVNREMWAFLVQFDVYISLILLTPCDFKKWETI